MDHRVTSSRNESATWRYQCKKGDPTLILKLDPRSKKLDQLAIRHRCEGRPVAYHVAYLGHISDYISPDDVKSPDEVKIPDDVKRTVAYHVAYMCLLVPTCAFE